MHTKIFLDNFPTIAEAPGAIQRLRELVLALALRGRLVPQDPTDEPAGALLDMIADTKLVSPSAITEPVKSGDALWVVPDSWRWTRLKLICDFSAGRTPATKDSTFWEDGEDGYHWVSIGDMPDGGEVQTTTRRVSERARAEVFRNEPEPPGTLLMSFKLTIGKIARLTIPAFHNEAIISIVTPFEATNEYLFRALPSLSRSGNSKAAIMGNTLNKASLTNLLVPLPPLAEQSRISTKVEELLYLCDELEARVTRKQDAAAALAASATALIGGA